MPSETEGGGGGGGGGGRGRGGGTWVRPSRSLSLCGRVAVSH